MGLATVFTGGHVLVGAFDPGCVVVLPLVVLNTIMGVVYIAAAGRIKADTACGRVAATAVAGANLFVLIVLVDYAVAGCVVAVESFVAMSARTGVWAGIVLALNHVVRRKRGRRSVKRPQRRTAAGAFA